MTGPVVGSAHIRIRPDVSQFAAELERRLIPQLARVQRQVNTAFGGAAGFQAAGATAAGAFSSSFGRTFSQQKSGLVVPVELAAQEAGKKVVATSTKAGKEAGKAIGTGFSTGAKKGFQEGFEALAAFAIAARIGRFFRDTVSAATTFQQAFANVRKTISGSEEDFARLEESIRQLSLRVPFAASEIAELFATAAQLGVPVAQLESFTETILRLGVSIRGLNPEEAARAFSQLFQVMQIAPSQIQPAASALVALGNEFGILEPEVLDISRSLSGMARNAGLSLPEVLGLAAGIRRMGGEFEAGSSAVRVVFQTLSQAVSTENRDHIRAFAETIGVLPDEFKRLAEADPLETFLRFLEGLRNQGRDSINTLEALGLAERRTSREIDLLTANTAKLREGLDIATTGFEENIAVVKESNIFFATYENRLKLLNNQFEETRRQIGGKLAPALVLVTSLFTGLNTATVSLGAGFAALTAGAFAFQRFSRIFREITGTIGGSKLSVGAFSAALEHSALTGQSFRSVLKGLSSGTLVYEASTNAATAGTIRAAAAQNAAAASAIRLSDAYRGARASGLGFAASANIATASVGRMNLALKGIGIAAAAAVGIDLLARALKALDEQVDKLRDVPSLPEIDSALLKMAEGVELTNEEWANLEKSIGGSQIAHNFNTFATTFEGILDAFTDRSGELGDVIDNALDEELRFIGTLIPGVESSIEQLRNDFQKLDVQMAAFAAGSPVAARLALEALAEKYQITPDQLLAVLDDTNLALADTENNARAAAIETAALGDTAAGVDNLAKSAAAAASALSFITAASSAFDAKLESFSAPFGQTLLQESDKAAKAGGKAADAANRVADAERDLARAREDAAERIADAERKLAEAEEDSIERVIEARRRLEQTRFEGRRRIRDARQELEDFEAALGRAGGAQTPDDLIRLRELREAVADARTDNTRSVREGLRDVKDAEEEGREAVIEAQRQLAEAHEEAAERIEDAARRIQEAQQKSAEAAAAASENIIDTIDELVASFNTDARLLEEFADLMTTTSVRIGEAFKDQEVADAFLAGLAEMGVEAIPILRGIVRKTPAALAGLEKVFANKIKQSKRAADFEFDKFPANWRQKLGLATQQVAESLDDQIGLFEELSSKGSGPAVDAVSTDLDAMILQIQIFSQAAEVALTPAEEAMLDLAGETEDASEKVRILKELVASIKSREVDLRINTDKAVVDLTKFVEDFEAAVEGKWTLELARAVSRQHGGPLGAGQAALVGEGGREFFIPNTAGTVLPNQQTERILAALRKFGGGGGGTIQNIHVYEVAQDPRATARSVSFAVGGGAIR